MNIKYFMIFLLFFMSGCVPVYYQIDSKFIDIREYDRNVEIVYVPNYRPRPMYYWNGMWYDEPYRYIPYQNLRGHVAPRKIPKRIYDQIERQKPVKPITPRRSYNRGKIRKIIKRRK